MKAKLYIAAMMALCTVACGIAIAQTTPPPTGDALGMHNLSVGSGSSVTTQGSLGCTFCHAPHSGLGGVTPLWNQTLSAQTYTPYTSSTYKQQGNMQPILGVTSSLCLSCHDGTVAVGQTAVFGKIPMQGTMNNMDVLGTNLGGSHPFSLVLPIKDSPDLAASLVAQGVTADPTGAVKLVNGNVECTSCHNPHVQGTDSVAQNFLVRDSSNGQMCLACHDPARVITAQTNPLSGWNGSIHQTATNQVAIAANVGPLSHRGRECLHFLPHGAQPQRVCAPDAAGDSGGSGCRCSNAGLYYLPRRHNREYFAGAFERLWRVCENFTLASGWDEYARCGGAAGTEQQSSRYLRGLPQPTRGWRAHGSLTTACDSPSAERRDRSKRDGWLDACEPGRQSV